MEKATLLELYLGVMAVLQLAIQVCMQESQRHWIGFIKNLDQAAEE